MAQRRTIDQLVDECFAESWFSVRQVVEIVRREGYGGRDLLAVARAVYKKVWEELDIAEDAGLEIEGDGGVMEPILAEFFGRRAAMA
ncbi:MAG: hypothetical protein AMXMBFR13_06970 [Phycisphaerae bacterium]